MIASIVNTFYLIIAALIIIIILFLLLRFQTSLIFGIYPPKGGFYRLKYFIARLLVKRLRYKFYPKDDIYPTIHEDNVQQLRQHPGSYDMISFMGANDKGEKLLINFERRRYGILKTCLYVWLPDKGLLALPKLPDMLHFTSSDGQDLDIKKFIGCGFTIYPEVPLKRWRIIYNGPLKDSNETLLDTKLDFHFMGRSTCFNYNRDLSSAVIADAIARESWNCQFYTMLSNVNQILDKRLHYEQHGFLKGTVQIADEPVRSIELLGFRDHSYGIERCLSTINRYVYVALFLTDGSSMVVGALSQPSFFLSSLKVGYICSPDGKYTPITDCNFELYSYGEKGQPPQHKNFLVSTQMQEYFVQIRQEVSAVRYAGRNWNSKIYNQFVSCCVNGLPGHGITEYLYRYDGGRPHELCANDPEWFKRLYKVEVDDESF